MEDRNSIWLDMSFHVGAAIKLFSLCHEAQGRGQEGSINLRESSDLIWYMWYFNPGKLLRSPRQKG